MWIGDAIVSKWAKNETERANYTRRQIKNDQPGSHDFRRFLRQFWTDFLEILQMPFPIKIPAAVKNSQNYILYFKS